jgi:hypothetical protein
MSRKRPPVTNRKLGAEARAELGFPRECSECGDTKEVSEKTFTPNNKGLRGWATVCKVCEALGASGSKSISKKTSKASFDVENDIEEMYFLASTGRDPVRMTEIADALADEIRALEAIGDREGSFRMFIDVCKPLIANWMEPGAIHDDIVSGLVSEHGCRLIIATRYSAKSTLTCIYVAWRVFLDPLIKVMVISHGAKLAARNLRTIRQILIQNCPVLQHLVPTEDCLDNAEQFQAPQILSVSTGGATLTSLGITSNLPGYRADLTIGDDVEGHQDNTPEKIEDLHETLNELHMINPKGEKVMLGTYQSEFSIYAKLGDLQNKDGSYVWETHRACMIEEDTINGERVFHSRWPEMFSEEDLYKWRSRVTERGWRLHVMLIADPSILNERPLKISQLVLVAWPPQRGDFPIRVEAGVVPVPDMPTWSAPKGDVWRAPRTISKETAPYVQTLVAVDPASGLAGRDAIGVAVLGITASGLGVIRHLEGVRGPDKTRNIRRVADICANFHAGTLVVEELADGLFGETLEGQLMIVNHPMSVEKVTTGGQQKGRRIIESLEPPMSVGRLAILEAVARSDHGGDFVNQMVRVSYDGRTGKAREHDDIVDALAHAVARAKYSLVSSVADNLGEHEAGKIDRLRRLPLRYGGLGGDGESKQTRSISIHGGMEEGGSLAERLIAEDECLARITARRDALQEQLVTDMTCGLAPNPRTKVTILRLTRQIDELRGMQVL